MSKAKERLLRVLTTRFDRLTAYGCAVRDMPYDAEGCALAFKAYWDEWNNPEGWDYLLLHE